MSLPAPLPFSPAGPGSTVRQLAASAVPGQIAGADSPTGKALLVHEIGGGLAAGAVGGTAIGQQVISAAAGAASVLVGTMLVNSGSAVAGSAKNGSATPGVLTITDSAGRVLARVALPAGQTTAFNPTLYPLLGKAGALASSDNDAAGGSVALGQTAIGMQFPNSSPATASPALIGWTTGEQDTAGHVWSINPATFPMTLMQSYVDATDDIAGFVFCTSGGGLPGSNMAPGATGTNQKILLFDPNGQPFTTGISTGLHWTAYAGSGTRYFFTLVEGPTLPGWWTLVDNGQGNDTFNAHMPDFGAGTVLGGGTKANDFWMAAYPSASQGDVYPDSPYDVATGAAVIQSPTSGKWFRWQPFSVTSRWQYQAAATLYRQAIQSLTFTATFPAVPNGATIVVSASS